jgi:hypothetical protein
LCICRSLRVVTFGEGSKKVTRQIAQPLDAYQLDLQTSLFKMTMKSNVDKMLEPPYDVNPVSKLWQKLGCNGLLLSKLSEFMHLAEIAITTVLGNVEDERTFSSLKFIKSKLRSRLEGNLPQLCISSLRVITTLRAFPMQMLTSISEQPRNSRVCTSETILSP